MPKQIRLILSDNGDGTANLQAGPFGATVQISDLFDRSQDQVQIIQNVGLGYRIGGYAKLNSAEFLAGVNQTGKGLEAKDQNYKIQSINLVDPNAVPQQYEVIFKNTVSGTTFGITVDEGVLSTDTSDQQPQPQDFVNNVNAFLRKSGYKTLTAAAILAVNNHSFWY